MFTKLAALATVVSALALTAPAARADVAGYPCRSSIASGVGGVDRMWVNIYSGPSCSGNYKGWASMTVGAKHSQLRVLTTWSNVITAIAQGLTVEVQQPAGSNELSVITFGAP